MSHQQLSFDAYQEFGVEFSPQIAAAIDELSLSTETKLRGAVFTRPEVVAFILDLAGYTVDRPLHRQRLLEPSFGGGDFLLPVVKRLLAAWRNTDGAPNDLVNAIHAIELHQETYEQTRADVLSLLRREGIAPPAATKIVDSWLVQGDFLLRPLEGTFDFVVGNPPYVRQEVIPSPLLAEYRNRYHTLYDRADLYVPFIERSLSHLAAKGVLGFICADRWMKNRYGGPLRRLVAEKFHLKIYVDMTEVQAFHTEVSAYPAVTIISSEEPGSTRIVRAVDATRKTLTDLATTLKKQVLPKRNLSVREAQVVNGADPWLLGSSTQMALIRRLERQYPQLEEVGCKVGIGVATGADSAFISDYESLDVEPDRKLPLVMTDDISSGEVEWRGHGVINPFDDDGLVDLNRYPRLRRYMEERKEVVAARHCARKKPENWYRTIDRITPSLTYTPKLLIPDIKGDSHIVFEQGELYPHHNLYYVTSSHWDLRALQAVLLSSVTRLFVTAYSTKMRGGFLRFQAQYLRRIRVPHWADVPQALRLELAEAARLRDLERCNLAVAELYDLTEAEQSALTEDEA
ncbi:MAG: Eco57I restriction-modification methylase domain-containing protein [Caldilineaceae bacterium]